MFLNNEKGKQIRNHKKSQICQNGGKCQNVKFFRIGATIRTH